MQEAEDEMDVFMDEALLEPDIELADDILTRSNSEPIAAYYGAEVISCTACQHPGALHVVLVTHAVRHSSERSCSRSVGLSDS